MLFKADVEALVGQIKRNKRVKVIEYQFFFSVKDIPEKVIMESVRELEGEIEENL